jgi:hypothetical protein
MSANIKASVDGTQAIIGVGGVDQMTVSNAGVVTANSFVGSASSATALATGSTTARTLANRFADVVNVLDFGAVGDGVTDDTAAIQAAFTNSVGKTIYFPKSANGYVCKSTITIPINTSIYFEQGAFIDATSATAPKIFSAIGTGFGASIGGGLSSTVSKGSQSITFNSAPSLQPNDIIIIHNTAPGSWNPARPVYKQGEFLIVQSVSGNTINLTTQVIDTYVSTCQVYKMTPTTCHFENVKIIGNRSLIVNSPTIQIQYGYGITLKNVEIIDSSANAIYISDTLNFSCEQIRVRKTVVDTGSVEANGLVVHGQNGKIKDCMLMSYRHPLSITGGGYVITRFVTADNCFLGSMNQWACDLGHGGIEYCGIENSQITSGALMSGQNNFLRNNTITARPDQLTIIQFAEMRSINHEITNNKIFIENAIIAIECGVLTLDAMTSNMIEDGTLRITNNEFVDTKNTAKSVIVIKNQGSTTQNNVHITNNRYTGLNTVVNYFANVTVVTGNRFEIIWIKDNYIENGNIGICETWAYLTVSRNLVFQSNLAPAFQFTQGLGYGIIENNQIGGYLGGSVISGSASTQLGYISFRNNLIRAGTTTGYVVSITYADQIDSSNNKIGNIDDTNTFPPFNVDSGGLAKNVTINGDVYYGGAPNVGANALNPSNFQFRKKISLSTPATSFSIWSLPANTLFMPTMAQARTDTIITATTGNYYSIGVNATNRRIDYGASAAAASSSQHAKNSMLRSMQQPSSTSEAVVGTEVLSLISVDSNSDAAALGSNIGGSNQTITVQIAGNLIGSMEFLP